MSRPRTPAVAPLRERRAPFESLGVSLLDLDAGPVEPDREDLCLR